VADKVHFAMGAIDDSDRPGGLICQGKGMLTAPGAYAIAAEVLGRDQIMAGVENGAELAPLRGAGTGAVKRYHRCGIRRRGAMLERRHGDLWSNP